MPASDAIRVKGLRDLQRAFALADKELKQDMNAQLKRAAEPVRADAQTLARPTMKRAVNVDWAQMRVGVTTTLVYVAPARRSTRRVPRKRPNLAPRLMDKAMTPALHQNADRVRDDVGGLLDRIGRDWARA
jgi:hypothetical protein